VFSRLLLALGTLGIASSFLLGGCAGGGASGGGTPTWSAPSTIRGVGFLAAVSCPTEKFCVAVGRRDAVAYVDGKWSDPTMVDAEGSVNGGLVTVSCTSLAFCVAGDGDGNAFTYDGARWSAPILVAKAGLAQLSCSTPSSCGAVDNNGDALFFNGSAWSRPQTIPGSSQPMAIACTTGTFCMAVDGGGDGAYQFDGGRWSSAGSLDVSTPQGGSEPNVGNAVACSAPTVCAALDNFGEAFTRVRRKWSAPVRFDQNLMDGSDAVSCPASSFCMVVDEDGVTTRWNGRAWSDARTIDAAELADVSCANARFCIAVDSRGRALTYR
jgi:hypothetical protein